MQMQGLEFDPSSTQYQQTLPPSATTTSRASGEPLRTQSTFQDQQDVPPDQNSGSGCCGSFFSSIGNFFVAIGYWFLENICCCFCSQSNARAKSIIDKMVEAGANNKLDEFKPAVESGYKTLSSAHKLELQEWYLDTNAPTDEQIQVADAAFRNVTDGNVQKVGEALTNYQNDLADKIKNPEQPSQGAGDQQ